jgi:NlpC/P60 family
MPRRLKPIVLLSLITAIALSLALFAGAQSGGGAVGTALGQVGKPYAFGTDGPGTFSCTGLVRFALRSIGIMDAPWDHYAYLSTYPTVASPEPGDVVVYPDGAAMYIGGGSVVMANHADGVVGTYPMDAIGTPVGFARPTGSAVEPAAVDPAAAVDQTVVDPAWVDPTIPVDQTMVDPALADPAWVDPALVDPATIPADPMAVDPATIPADPMAVDPATIPVDPAAVPVEQVPVDSMLPV